MTPVLFSIGVASLCGIRSRGFFLLTLLANGGNAITHKVAATRNQQGFEQGLVYFVDGFGYIRCHVERYFVFHAFRKIPRIRDTAGAIPVLPLQLFSEIRHAPAGKK